MFNNRFSSIFLAALLTLGAIAVSAPEAHADAASLARAFQQRHARAARSTGAASREWSRYGQLSQQFDAAMRSPNARVRANAKRVATQWLGKVKRMIATAARDHRSAISAMNSYLRYVGSNPQAQQLRAQLVTAERGLQRHINELTNIASRVSRMA